MKRFTSVILIFAMLLTLAACGGRQAAVPETPDTDAPTKELGDNGYFDYLPDTSDETADSASEDGEELSPEKLAEREAAEARARQEAAIQAFIAGMTLEEKVGQLFFVRCLFNNMEDAIAKYHLGGVLLFTQDYKNAADEWLSRDDLIAKLKSYQSAAAEDTGIRLFIGSDEEGGTVTRASRNPNLFPSKSRSPQELYAAGGMGTVLNDAAEKSYTLRELGVNINFAPVCDVSTDPNDFIYDRSFGKNAGETAAYVAGVVMVMGDAGMGSVLKHFPGYGSNVDTHTGIAIDERPFSTFYGSDFLPFVAGIQAGSKLSPFVLVSHNIVTCMDDTLPASLSPAVHQILRDELHFDGVALTDDLAMDAVKAYAEDGNAAVLALQAGNDMIVTSEFWTDIPRVIAAVEDGTLDESVIDAALTRVLRAKAERFAMPWELEG